MELLDRVILIVRPRAPFARWAIGAESDSDLRDLRKNPAVYAVERSQDHDPQIIRQMHWRTIFEAELAVWNNDRSQWPRNRTLPMFRQWFEVDACPLVVDLVPRRFTPRKPIAWITDLTHYLDDSRQPVLDLPAPVRNLANYFGSIAADVSAAPLSRPRRLAVRCRRKPGRRPCPGFIEAAINSDGQSIEWRCCVCGDNGVLSGWRHTAWDRSPKHDTAPAPIRLGP